MVGGPPLPGHIAILVLLLKQTIDDRPLGVGRGQNAVRQVDKHILLAHQQPGPILPQLEVMVVLIGPDVFDDLLQHERTVEHVPSPELGGEPGQLAIGILIEVEPLQGTEFIERDLPLRPDNDGIGLIGTHPRRGQDPAIGETGIAFQKDFHLQGFLGPPALDIPHQAEQHQAQRGRSSPCGGGQKPSHGTEQGQVWHNLHLGMGALLDHQECCQSTI